MDCKLSNIVGLNIAGHRVTDDNQVLWLEFEGGGKAKFKTYAECCSHTWIESLDAPGNLRGKVLSIEEIDMPNLGDIPTVGRPEVERVKYYGLRIVTENGHCVIDYRNDSNGYYGGSLDLVELDTGRKGA